MDSKGLVLAHWVPLGLSVAIGATATAATATLDIPGNGSWMVACWCLGAVAALIRPSRGSYAACVAGIVLATIFFVALGGQYAGLSWLVVIAVAAVLGHGFLVGAAVGRAWRLRSVRDATVVRGLAVAIGLVVAGVLIAQEFARNPP
jgi:hypothetical protein